MSPTSQQQQKENQQKEIKNMRKKLLHYERTELPLDDEQSNEMEAITTAINQIIKTNCKSYSLKVVIYGLYHI